MHTVVRIVVLGCSQDAGVPQASLRMGGFFLTLYERHDTARAAHYIFSIDTQLNVSLPSCTTHFSYSSIVYRSVGPTVGIPTTLTFQAWGIYVPEKQTKKGRCVVITCEVAFCVMCCAGFTYRANLNVLQPISARKKEFCR